MKEESQSEEKAEKKKEKDEKGEKKENVKTAEPLDQSHYWVVHLDYDVDSLLVDIWKDYMFIEPFIIVQ